MLGQDGTEHLKSASLRGNMTKRRIYGALDVSYMNSLSIVKGVTKYLMTISRNRDTFSLVIHAFLCQLIRKQMTKDKK